MASIPLPALDIKPQQAPNTMEQLGQLMQMKNMMGQQQLQQQQLTAAQQENKMRQMEIDDRGTIMESYKAAKGNLDKTIELASQRGVSNPATLIGLKKASVEQQMQNIALFKAKGEQAVQEANLMQGAHDTVAKAPPEQRPAVWQQQLGALQQAGVDVSQVPQQYPGDQAFSVMGLGIQDHKTQLENLAKEAQTRSTNAEAEQKEGQNAYAKQHGLAPGVSPEMMEMGDYLQKNPGKGPKDFAGWKASLVPAARFSIENNAAPKPGESVADVAKRFGMTEESFNQAAERYSQTGTLPPLGRGISGVALNRALMNRAGELHPGASLAENSAAFNANKHALEKVQAQSDQVDAFEKTALKNLDLVLQKAKAVPDLDTRFGNVPIRLISEKMLGTKEMAEFRTALVTAQTESAKVLNSANATGVLTNDARHELEQLLGGNLPYRAFAGVVNTLKQDMSNRHDSYAEQISDIKQRFGGKAQISAPAPSGVIYARDPQGKLHSAPAGTQLPAGWTVERK